MSCLSFTFLKVGFVHAEDQYWEQGQHTGGGKAYKSVSLGRSEWEHSLYSGIKPKFYCFEFSSPKYFASVCSQDLGISWSRKGQVKIVELLTGCQIFFFEGSYGWGQAICSCLGRNWGLWCGENWQSLFKLEELHVTAISIRRDWTFWREQKAGPDTWMQVWDWQKDRWFMVGSHMRMAASKHKGGAFGWRGYCTSSLYIYMAVVNSCMCTFHSLLAKVGRWRFHHQLIILGWN